MSGTAAVRCDRCSARALCGEGGRLPDGWGTVMILRNQPFLSTGELDLCASCIDAAYAAVRTQSQPSPIP